MTLQLIISILFSLMTSYSAVAQTLLVPDESIHASDYTEKCQREGYTCIQNFLLTQKIHEPTPLFDTLMDTMDLNEQNFLSSLPKQVQKIIESESVSLEQLEMLVRLLEQADTRNSLRLLNELKFIVSAIPTDKKVSPLDGDYILFFKTPLSKKEFHSIKKSYLDIPYFTMTFNRLPQRQSTKTLNQSYSQKENFSEYLVKGTCQTATILFEVGTESWKILSEKSCGWSSGLASTLGLFTTLKENKHWIITGALVIGAAVLANQYEVQFQF